MKKLFLDTISPSLEMTIQSFIPNESIELTGRNNWNTLVLVHSLIIIVSVILGYFAVNSAWFENFMLYRLVIILSSIGIGTLVYDTFKTARNSTYLKEEIRFSKEGIVLKSKSGEKPQFLKREGLKSLYLIFDGQRFKFLLYGLDKPYFEFSIAQNEKIGPDVFLKQLTKIFDLEIQDGATFGVRTILTLKKKPNPKLKQKKKKLALLKKEKQSISKDSGSVKAKLIDKYKPKGFYYYQQKKDLIIEQNIEGDILGLSKKIGISRRQKEIWYRNDFLLKRTIKFS